MSTTAVGITLDLDGPLPVARRYSLLATPGVVVEDNRDAEGEPRWMNGVNVVGYSEGTPETWEPCSTGTFRTKEDGEGETFSRFDPISVYFPNKCSTIGLSNARVQRMMERTELVLEATLATGVERALAEGVPGSNNAFLGDTDFVALASGAAVAPRVGLSYLENAIAQLTGRQGVIHATPATVTSWGFGDELNPSNDPITEAPPALGLRTSNGTPVISGAGYIGAHPQGSGGLAGPGDTTEWAFASGPVEVRLGQGPEMEVHEVVDRQINQTIIRAERFVLYDWDRALQVGVLIDWSL